MLRQAQHERGEVVLQLQCHPDTPASKVSGVEVELRPTINDSAILVYRVRSADTLMLPNHPYGWRDGLWQGTCFEFFSKAANEAAYREFNFAPVFAWAAYGFTDWRAGMMPLDLAVRPHLVDCRLDDRREIYPSEYELDVVLGAGAIPNGGKLSLTAVIEETNGTKSYWALRHPPGKPDFHHPDCFALELPALA